MKGREKRDEIRGFEEIRVDWNYKKMLNNRKVFVSASKYFKSPQDQLKDRDILT
jgi:hypothetical protein